MLFKKASKKINNKGLKKIVKKKQIFHGPRLRSIVIKEQL